MADSDPRIALLPGAIRPVAETCGFDQVVGLIEAFGGMRLYVPAGGVSRAIAARCGEPVAEALRLHFGGDYVVLPVARKLAVARKHAAIRADKRPAAEVARAHRMSVNSIHRIRGETPKAVPAKPPGRRRAVDERQIDLEAWLRGRT